MLPKMAPNVYLNFLQKDTCKPQNGRFLNRFMTITSLLMKNRWKSIPNLPSHEAHQIPHPKIHLADFWMCAPYLFTFWSFHFLEYQKKKGCKRRLLVLPPRPLLLWIMTRLLVVLLYWGGGGQFSFVGKPDRKPSKLTTKSESNFRLRR